MGKGTRVVMVHEGRAGVRLGPPLKWAGGKRWLVPRMAELWRARAEDGCSVNVSTWH